MWMNRSLSLSFALAFALPCVACARAPAPDAASTLPSTAATAATSGAFSQHEVLAASVTEAAADAASATRASARSSEPAAEPLEGKDFLPEAQVIFRVAACGGSGDIPARFDPGVVARHCEELNRAYDDYRHSWVDAAAPFLASIRPKDLPATVVYPFGGGDLTSALATFPDAREITTISLEPAGDVRPADTLAPERLSRELTGHRAHLERLFLKAHSRTENLEKESKTELPGEVLFSLAALAVYGDEPVSLRYFRLTPDGSVAYVTQEDLDAEPHMKPADRRALFANVELRFRPSAGHGDPSKVTVLRHVSFNLDDTHLKADPSLLAYLNGPGRGGGGGKVATMTKAATHLLWDDHFSTIRTWLVDHTDWMVSDSTGIPPRIAGPAGFVQDTYGTFDGPSPYGLPDARDARDLKRLFASQPERDLAFRYGYPDRDGHAHLLVTRRAAPSP
jgi:hypothetical protein